MATGRLASTDIQHAIDQPNPDLFRLATILNSLPDAVYTSTLAGTITSWNDGARQLFGVPAEEAVGLHVARLIPSTSRVKLTRVLARVAAREQVETSEMSFLNRGEETVEAAVRAVPVLDESNHVVEVVWHVRDIRELRRLEEIVWEETERTETAFGLVSDGVITTDDTGRIVYMNPAAEQLTSLRLTAVHGSPVSRVIQLVHEESREPVDSPVDVCLREGHGLDPSNHNAVVRSDGTIIPVEDSVALLVNRTGEVTGTVFVLRPSDHSVDEEETETYLASYDRVTGAVTRRELEHRLEQALVQTAREDTRHVLLYLKLTRYAEIVALHGEIAGQECLKQVSAMLQAQVRDMDTVARIHEDEFGILLKHCPHEQAKRIASHLRETVSSFPFYWKKQAYDLDVRIGITSITADSGKVAGILETARQACRNAAADGSGAIHVLETRENSQFSSPGLALQENQVSRALAQDRFRLYGQRIAPLSSDQARSEQCEMFLYMADETGRMIRPSVFLPVAKQAGHMEDLDRWVVRTVFRMLSQSWQPEIAIWTVNLSVGSLLDESFPEYVKAQFAEFGVPPHWICFEIEEPAAIEHLGATMRFIRELRPLGFAFSLSHFGTSMNTFSYLRNLPVDYLKLDASLVRDILDDPVSRAIVGSICLVAHVMGMRTIAGQIEDEEMFESLRRLEVDYVQGYAVGEPEPLSTVS